MGGVGWLGEGGTGEKSLSYSYSKRETKFCHIHLKVVALASLAWLNGCDDTKRPRVYYLLDEMPQGRGVPERFIPNPPIETRKAAPV